MRQLEDRLRVLIFDATDRSMWNVKIEPIDTPPIGTIAIDLDAAVSGALRDRNRPRPGADGSGQHRSEHRALEQPAAARCQTERQLSGKRPWRNRNPSHRRLSLEIIAGPGNATPFGSVLDQLLANDYPTWSVGVSVCVSDRPQHPRKRNLARNRLEHAQAGERVKSAEARVVQQVRSAGWKLDMNAKRIDVARSGA